MERKIGEIFEYNGEWYKCIEQPKDYIGDVCKICSFSGIGNCELDRCVETYRSDKKSVIFKKLEKVGEPFVYEGKVLQRLRSIDGYSCVHCLFKEQACNFDSCDKDSFLVETELKLENMEEKKLNLKPFDLEAAKAGKPVCTRDGRKARIICFDAKRKDGKNIMALIPSKEYPGFEDLVAYPNNGNYHGGHENDGDLMMLPEKKEGWVNIYNRNRPRTSSENCYIMTGVSVFETKEGAISYIDKDKEYIDTVKIEWEE